MPPRGPSSSNSSYVPPRRPPAQRPQKVDQDGPRINDMIRAPEIRVIDESGEMVGVMRVPEALRMAEAAGLDLVEISPNVTPPVCKILDYGKYKYEQQKKAAEAKKKQKVIEIKEIKLRPGIEKHDYEVKLKQARGFIEEGNKVKFTLKIRGREMSHMELALAVLKRVKEDTADIAKVEQDISPEGRQALMVIVPAK